MSKRKAFNFYRSYWDTGKEIKDVQDRLSFYEAIFLKQFENTETELSGISKFAYVSQRHSIESQVKGYVDVCKKLKINAFEHPTEAPSKPPYEGGNEAPTEAPSVQVKEKEKEKEEVKVKEKVKFIPPTILEVENYFIENNFSKDLAKRAYNFYNIADWKDSKGKKVKNWKQKMQGVWFKEENKEKKAFEQKKESINGMGYKPHLPGNLF